MAGEQLEPRSGTRRMLDTPGGELLTWLPLVGLALMAINDHWLRPRWPGLITGKLSDLGVVLFFPFLLTATIGWLAWAFNATLGRMARRLPPLATRLTPARLTGAIVVTGLVLAAINLSTTARDLYVATLNRVDLCGLFGSFRYTADPSDCVALVLLPIVWWWGRRL